MLHSFTRRVVRFWFVLCLFLALIGPFSQASSPAGTIDGCQTVSGQGCPGV